MIKYMCLSFYFLFLTNLCAHQEYTINTISPIDDSFEQILYLTDINDNGVVVGYGETEDYEYFSFIWDLKAGFKKIPGDHASSINIHNQVSGGVFSKQFLWDNKNGYEILNLERGMRIVKINNNAKILASHNVYDENGKLHPYMSMWTREKGEQKIPFDSQIFAADLNDQDCILFDYFFDDPNEDTHTFVGFGILQNNVVIKSVKVPEISIPDLKIVGIIGIALNQQCDVVGCETVIDTISKEKTTKGMIWLNDETIVTLKQDTLCQVVDINDHRQAIGNMKFDVWTKPISGDDRYTDDYNLETHPFIWTAEEGVADLNDLIPIEKQHIWELKEVIAINNFGQIIGTGVKNKKREVFLLTPKSESRSWRASF